MSVKTNVPGALFMGVLIGIGAAVFAASNPLPDECIWQPEMAHVIRHLGVAPQRRVQFIYEEETAQ